MPDVKKRSQSDRDHERRKHNDDQQPANVAEQNRMRLTGKRPNDGTIFRRHQTQKAAGQFRPLNQKIKEQNQKQPGSEPAPTTSPAIPIACGRASPLCKTATTSPEIRPASR